MSQTLSISPVTRIEGHLAVRVETEPFGSTAAQQHRITAARCEGEMFRGFERILIGRDPLDAQQITQRICGVCPISHATASIRAQEAAYQIQPNHNGIRLQNLILAANYLQSHILHFYHLAALDYVDATAVLNYAGDDRTLKLVRDWVKSSLAQQDALAGAPLLPHYQADYIADVDRNARLLKHYLEALNIRRLCHEMGAVFGARLPHATAIVPGGCTQTPSMDSVLAYNSRLKQVYAFVEEIFLPDLQEVAKEFPQYFEVGAGYRNFLCYGAFPIDGAGLNKFIQAGAVIDGKWEPLDQNSISEEVAYSRYVDHGAQHPTNGQLQPDPDKPQAYSWIKAPRYRGQPMEVGALARLMTNSMAPGGSWMKSELDAFLASAGLTVEHLVSVLGRHLARGLECLWLARQASRWLNEIEVDGCATVDFDIPSSAKGVGLTEAPRGALGHWISIENYRIAQYQCVVPTTWNCSPRDTTGRPGPVEKALENTSIADPTQPIEAGRVVRSFDPCLACAVH